MTRVSQSRINRKVLSHAVQETDLDFLQYVFHIPRILPLIKDLARDRLVYPVSDFLVIANVLLGLRIVAVI